MYASKNYGRRGELVRKLIQGFGELGGMGEFITSCNQAFAISLYCDLFVFHLPSCLPTFLLPPCLVLIIVVMRKCWGHHQCKSFTFPGHTELLHLCLLFAGIVAQPTTSDDIYIKYIWDPHVNNTQRFAKSVHIK